MATRGAAYEAAIDLLQQDRRAGLAALESAFAGGAVPDAMSGEHAGRLVAVGVTPRLDRPFEALGRLWLPWQGKTFDAERGEGTNIFSAAVRPLLRVTMPAYRHVRRLDAGRISAFRFRTSVGPSAVRPDVPVLRIDYRDVAENPAWPVRRVLDEVVRVGEGTYLGQALLQWRGALRRVAWFSLHR